jgi:hypothetical protein
MKTKIEEVVGIDLGNTIIKHRKPLPDAFRVIRRLIDERFGERLHIVSRVDEQQEIRARAFVTGHEFQSALGIPLTRVHFCRERHEKGPICERLRITHFIDDRPEVMVYMPTSVIRKVLFDPDQADLDTCASLLGDFNIARSWLDVERLLLL